MTSVPIEVSKVTKRFGDVQALDGVDLTVGRGEMFGLIGHNGAGKSTLFKLMLGLLPPSGGTIRVCGTPLDGASFRSVRRRIGYLPEHFVTYDNLSGIEVLQLFADLKRVPRRECEAVLERVGLKDAAKRRVRGYSKGMRQRLGFAQVLLGNPELIFLDEPTNGLDAEGIHDFYRILREVQSQGATIVITSHILAEIQERVDRLVILSGGRVAAQGTLAELRAQMNLPSTIEVKVEAGWEQQLQAVLSSMHDLRFRMEGACAQIAVPSAQKVPVLQVLSMQQGVRDIAIREPSLEDVFLGYGESHA
ncbi:MAG TPA: ABC transporter ATP-binding protein [Noviherbaspirillum sp.]|uniref:ABC transporter ATP-binding protein n=1 Tax=Noviherbaspirillum sp. TaxID=1926288 RepID=UPI002D654845|nr:ABC transporter ATP-binding protein [Noviherbaspirillum sp.]HYD95884.1 ABC transporter ATP-binding protein [Noviherbaspirillum sp.]